MVKNRPTTIPEYLAAAPPEARPHLRRLYRILKSQAPAGTGVIKWNVPVFWEGRVLFGFAACRKHVSFGPGPATIRHFAKELAPHKTGKGTLQIPYDRPFPEDLVRRIAVYCRDLPRPGRKGTRRA